MERRSSSRGLLVAGKMAVLAGLALLIAVGLFFVRLLQGPISLSFLIPPIQRAIAEDGSGLRVDIADAAVRLAGGQLEFVLSNVRVSDDADTPLALAPSAAVSLSRRALLSGRIAPESVDLISPRLLLFHGEDGSVSLAFSHPSEREDGETARGPRGRAVAPAASPASTDTGDLGRIDLIKVLSQASASARKSEHAGAYLRELGLQAATVIIDNGSRRSVWRVPELKIDLDHHRSRSSIAGRMKVDSLAGPWTIDFRTFELENSKQLQIDASVQGLVPRGLALSVPQLAVLEGLDAPVWAEAHVTIANTGEIENGKIAIDAAPGYMRLPGLLENPLKLEGGHLALSYSRSARRFEIEPSALVWGDSRVQFTGVIRASQSSEAPGWAFELKSAGGWLGAEPPQLERLAIDDWSARGFFSPRGRLVLSQFTLKAGGAEVSAEGEIADQAGAMLARLDGKIGAMPANVFKSLWPTAVAPRTRRWVVERLVRGSLQGGTFQLASGRPGRAGEPAAGKRNALTLEGSNLAFAVVDGWPTLEAPRALLRLDDQALELSIPDANLALRDGRRLTLKGTMSVDMHEPSPRIGRFAVKGQGSLPVVLDLMGDEALSLLQSYGVAAASIDGKIEGQGTVSLPLDEEIRLHDVRLEGRARISEGRMRLMMGGYDITGASVAIDMTGAAVEAKGDMLVNGVPAKAYWQHVFDVPADKQPPGRITATLDDGDRTQLGLDINDIVEGDVGVEVSLAQDARGERLVHVRSDLVNAEVTLDSIAWRKPKGRPSVFEFDPVKGSGAYPLELHNVRMVGENVAIEGWMGIGADNKAKEFRFPNFSLNVVTSLVTQGKVRPDGVWDVTAKGPTFDGRELFRSFFDVAQVEPSGKPRPGLDLRAEIDTVVGYYDSNLHNVRLSLQKRYNKLTMLDLRAVQAGGKPFAAVLRPESSQPRRLRAESTDAGEIFKAVGFYPNAVGGAMNLEVNLDGEGAAERTGTLWARDFVILGDPIISELVQNGVNRQGGGRGAVVREQFEFEILRAPFSVGHGQFVMHDAVINGPLVSASMRGKVDFRSKSLDVGGTYVPMSGLMRAPAEIPVVGPLLTGPRGEGVFGMTFAIQGSMAKPELVMNPLSIITPGIFRELFQMTPDDPHVLPRERPTRRGDAARSSSAPATSLPTTASGWPPPIPEVGGSWSVETSQPTANRR
jgi:hypothetical protein